jgi:hypothetical protein
MSGAPSPSPPAAESSSPDIDKGIPEKSDIKDEESSEDGAGEESPPDVPEEELHGLLEMLREETKKSKRRAMVVVLGDKGVDRAYITTCSPVVLNGEVKDETDPVPTTDARFVANVDAVWKKHDPKAAIIVIVTRPEPRPFLGLKLTSLPWAPAGRTWCPRCGGKQAISGHKC